MHYTLTIHKLHPWREFNEYEGHLEGVIDGRELCAYVLMYAERQWNQYAPGDSLPVTLWLERNGPVTILDTPAPPALRQLEGISYEVVGTVSQIDGDSLWLDSVLSLQIDLDPPVASAMSLPAVQVGDQVSIVGVLKVDLEPDEEE